MFWVCAEWAVWFTYEDDTNTTGAQSVLKFRVIRQSFCKLSKEFGEKGFVVAHLHLAPHGVNHK